MSTSKDNTPAETSKYADKDLDSDLEALAAAQKTYVPTTDEANAMAAQKARIASLKAAASEMGKIAATGQCFRRLIPFVEHQKAMAIKTNNDPAVLEEVTDCVKALLASIDAEESGWNEKMEKVKEKYDEILARRAEGKAKEEKQA